MKLATFTLPILLLTVASSLAFAQPVPQPEIRDWQMDPQMMEQMRPYRQEMMGRGMDPDYQRRHQQMREQMMQRHQQMMERRGDMDVMPAGPGMDPEMMRQMRERRMQHMRSMEQRLDRIEALLQQLVEQQKQ